MRRSIVGLGLCAILLTACSATVIAPPTPDELSASGSYQLSTANGSPLPLTYPKDSRLCVRAILGGSLALRTSPNAYTFSVDVRSVCDQGIGLPASTVNATLLENGTWTVTGTSFAAQHQGGSVMLPATSAIAAAGGTISGNALITFRDSQTVTAALLFKR